MEVLRSENNFNFIPISHEVQSLLNNALNNLCIPWAESLSTCIDLSPGFNTRIASLAFLHVDRNALSFVTWNKVFDFTHTSFCPFLHT